MVSVLFRCYRRLPSSFTLARFVFNQNLVRSQRCCLVRAGSLPASRAYSSERDQNHPKPKVVVFGIPNPFIWIRTRICYFLIRTYLDEEFSIEEFTQGAKQAFSHVSRLLSRCQFEALEGLVAKDLVRKLKQKCGSLPCSYQRALCAEPQDMMYTMLGDMAVFLDHNGELRSGSTNKTLTTAHLFLTGLFIHLLLIKNTNDFLQTVFIYFERH
ncbi:m-AAA protease-interacting protein 1, mitochondrial-like isoform X2 [Poeciliopsis prolifica]|uniref:m-AAA protease-interacting protein 1, mitochondrial-like isoform X2 n=1 Tax=Poeciliopsis prolifica TaxID=188132 RepID=UPI002413F662|nr:m-AAA protease-interacting protein 1, mitochondrial-like isoform X2 [Poeciliopsis prolifica]